MITTINNIHLRILKNKDVYQIYPDNAIIPQGDMEWNGKEWVFVQKDVSAELKAIEKEISDFIEK